jgi:hypothetical protein
MKKGIRKLIKYFLGFFIIFLLIYKVGTKEIYQSILNTDMSIFLIVPFVYVLSLFVGAINIWILLRPIKKLRLFQLFMNYWWSSSIGMLLPGKIGNFSILYYLKNKEISVGIGTSVVLIDKIITIIVSAIITFFALLFFFDMPTTIRITFVMVAGIFVFIYALYSNRTRSFAKKYILRKYSKLFTGFSATFFTYFRRHKKLLGFDFAVTIIRQAIGAFMPYLIFLSAGYNINFLYIFFISGIEFVVSLIPLTISGLGIRESTGVYLFSLIGIPASVTVGRYILGLAVRYFIAAIPFFIVKDLKSLNQ